MALFNIERVRTSGKLFYMGNAVLKYKIEFFRTDNEDITAFYAKTAGLCEKFCQEKLLEAIKEGGEGGAKYFYELNCEPRKSENGEDILSVFVDVVLKKDGKIIFETKDEKKWEISSGMMIKTRVKKRKMLELEKNI